MLNYSVAELRYNKIQVGNINHHYRFGKFYLGIFHITHLFIEGVKIQKVL